MDQKSFLHDLHVLGAFDSERFRAVTFEGLSPRARQAADAFEAVVGEFPPGEIEAAGSVPDSAMARMAELGLFGLTIPRDYGGTGLSFAQYLKVVARVAPLDLSQALVSLAHLSIGLQGIVLYGTHEQKQRYLVPAAAGKLLFAYALTEPSTGSDAKHIRTSARLAEDGSHYVLNGQKTYITNANYAGAFTVFAQLEGHRPGYMGAFVVERDWDGVWVGKDMPKMGLKASSTAALRFEDVRVPAENLLGRPGDGFRIAMTILSYGRLAVCAGGVGLMERSLADMVKRASGRIQFGVPILNFELVQEKLAEARAHAFAAASMVEFAAHQLDAAPTANIAAETSHCKFYCTTRAWQTLYDAMQVAGGSGYLATNPYEKRMRDYRVATIFEGTTEIHSTYAPLYLMRAIASDLPRGTWGRVVALLRGALRRPAWPLSPRDPVAKRASRVSRACGRWVRWLLRLGLLLYGRDVGVREFFVRRITLMSVHQYALLASQARIEADRRAGAEVDGDLECLAYLTEEAREALWENRWPWPRRRERWGARIVRRLR